MGWQDRDYAQAPTPRGGFAFARGSGSGAPWHQSIVTVLMVINIGIYVIGALFPPFQELLHGYGTRSMLGMSYHRGIAEMQGEAVLGGQLWRLVTAQYLHAGIWHLGFNMIGLHFLGRPLERMSSRGRLLAIYTLCGVCGNLFFTLLAWRGVINPLRPAVGASGSILGLLGMVAVWFPNTTVFVFPIPFPLKIRTVAYVLAGIAFLTILERGRNFGGEACHLAGLAFGVLWAMKGDAWWSNRSQRAPTRPANARSRPGRGFKAKVEQRRVDAKTIDGILRKVYDGGIHSLSEAEKRDLHDATERQKVHESQADRIDRM